MTTQTQTQNEQVLDIIRERLKYYSADVVLSEFTSVRTLRAAYESQSGGTFWFSPNTLRAFGSRNLHTVAAGILCETQTKHPGGTAWAITAWIYSDYHLHAVNLGYFDSLRRAEKFGALVAQVWRSAEKSGSVLTGLQD